MSQHMVSTKEPQNALARVQIHEHAEYGLWTYSCCVEGSRRLMNWSPHNDADPPLSNPNQE